MVAMRFRTISIVVGALILYVSNLAHAQRTNLDIIFGDFFRPLRQIGIALFGRSGESARNLKRLKALDKSQNFVQPNMPYMPQNFCDVSFGHSAERPTSVHRLRPGDIDVIGAMGDSLTAGNGIFAANIPQVTIENRGASFSIGGRGNWREFLTLPNILKEFNPQLYGYSLRDGLASDRSSKFNVAELGAISQDMPYMAKVLVKRLQRDPRVNMTHDWKLVTLLIGNNDFCSEICIYANPDDAVKRHERNILKTYRYLRDNVPRLLLNVVKPPNLLFLTKLTQLPAQCQVTLPFECPCLCGLANVARLPRLKKTITKWLAKDQALIERNEFNTETFTINYQPFATFDEFFKRPTGGSDVRFLSEDCFHLSQKGQAIVANALWNNMWEAPSNKSLLDPLFMRKFLCPTASKPYFATRVNTQSDFQV